MAKKVEIEIDVKDNGKVKGLGQEIRELTKQLRQTPEGTKEWGQIYNKIDDLKDKLASSKKVSMDWIDTLEEAGGPLGMLGGALNKVKVATQSWGAALKATGIGLIVSLIGTLVAAFSQTEGSLKKLEPLFIAIQKMLGGIVEAVQPLIDGFVELAMDVMPYVTKAFNTVFSAVTAVFQSLGKLGGAVVKLIKGDFAGAWEDAKASVTSFGDNYNKASERFIDGSNKMTKIEKENLEKQEEARKKAEEARKAALEKRLKEMDTQDKLDDALMEKEKARALASAQTEQEKLDIEKRFLEEAYVARVRDLKDKMALYKQDSDEWKALQTEKIKLETDFINNIAANKQKQKELTEKKNKELMDAEIQALQLQKAKGLIDEEKYQESIYQIKKKYLTDKKDLIDAEIAYEEYLKEKRKKNAEEERNIRLSVIQNQLNDIDRLNSLKLNDYKQDLARLAEKKQKLDEAEKIELENTELTEYEKTQIKQKYADKRKEITQQEIDTERAYKEAVIQGITQTLDSLASVTSAVASLYDEEAKTSKSAFEKRKSLQIATAVMSAASGIIQILTQPSTLPSPFDWITKGINVAALIVATTANINKIKSTKFEGAGGGGGEQPQANGLGRGYAEGGLLEGPRHAQGGVMINAEGGEAVMTRGAVSMFGPLLSQLNQIGGGRSFTKGASGLALPDSPKTAYPTDFRPETQIIKTYVVEGELTSAQQKQARLKDLSTI